MCHEVLVLMAAFTTCSTRRLTVCLQLTHLPLAMRSCGCSKALLAGLSRTTGGGSAKGSMSMPPTLYSQRRYSSYIRVRGGMGVVIGIDVTV
mmetsp:Transcript_49709/g.82499  ORF Transcript_49709/g.82499 Transcript_49709/m.82499 type:complete len:92 (+) Transcript_49709:422-697(+)